MYRSILKITIWNPNTPKFTICRTMSKRHSGFLIPFNPITSSGLSTWRTGISCPEGWAGFLDIFGVDNIGQVRINDNNGDYEIHLVPGEGTIDFDALFKRLNAMGYKGWFSLGFGNAADKIRVKNEFKRKAIRRKNIVVNHSHRSWAFGHAVDFAHALCQRCVHG